MVNYKKIYITFLLIISILFVTSCDAFGGQTNNEVDGVEGINFVVNGGSKLDAITDIQSGDVITLPEPTKEGYEFLGWYLNKELTGAKLPRSYTYPGGKIVLYADWMPVRYNIYLESAEEELTTVSTYAHFGEVINVDAPVSDYYDFVGWMLDGVLINDKTTMPANDITLTAVWAKKHFTVTLNIDGGSVDGFVSQYNIETGDTIELPTPTKEHAIFSGWYDSQGMLYTSNTPILKEMTLKAVYKDLSEYDDSYHITYVTEGTVPEGFDEYTVGVEFTLPTPERSGFIFKGWFVSPVFYGEAVTKLNNTTVLDQLFYAKWQEDKVAYDVTYIYPNGTQELKSVTKGEKALSLSLDADFGWFNGTSLFDFDTLIYEDLVLYANFKELNSQLSNLISNVVTKDQSFLTKLNLTKNYTITYSSSDPDTLSNKGAINPDRFDKIIELTCTFSDGTTLITQKFEVIVPAIKFKDLTTIKPVFAYVYAGSHKGFSDTFMNTVDCVNLAFGRVLDDSTISLNDVASKLDAILKVRKDGIRVVLSIGGGGSSLVQFSNAAYTAESRAAFANSILELIKKYHFDGVDIDWEYPGYQTGRDVSVDKPNFTLLMAVLYQTLKAYDPSLLITAALPGGRWGYERYALDKVEKYLDYIHLMTYDFHDSQKALHHTALYPSTNTSSKSNIKESVELYVSEGVPMNKLIVGCAFYGRVYVLSGEATTEYGIGSTNVVQSGAYMPYTAIYDYLKNHRGEYISYYDPKACAPSIYIPGENKVITYDSANSISAKCKYVYATNVGGIMYWENGEDQTDLLLQALYKGMKLQK